MESKLSPFLNQNITEAGCDEAGRGCLAGPVFAAAVILPKNFFHPLLNDSKQLTHKQRLLLKKVVEHEAISFSVQMVSSKEIDRINILNASILAMHMSISQLNVTPQYLLIDGNRFKPYPGIPHKCVIKGDSKFASIAAASILAKTYRDEYMQNLSNEFPIYGWEKNKGYPTQEHRNAIAAHGPCIHHRTSFKLVDEQLSFNF